MSKKKQSGISGKTQDQIEEDYGLSYALFKHFPELRHLLSQAIAGGYTANKFQVELRQTGWYKHHSDVWRKNTALRYSDPATFQQRLNQQISNTQNLAASVGVHLSKRGLHAMAERGLLFGWDEGEFRNVLANYVRPSAAGHYGGDLASQESELRALAAANGLNLGGSYMQSAMRAITRGEGSVDQFKTHIRDLAAKTFSAYGDQIKAGVNLSDIASPYVQSMAQTLELNPGQLDMFDPTIRKALTGVKDAKTGEYSPMAISDFEESLRRDPRWQHTKTAKDQARGYAASLSRLWGLS